MLDKDRPILSNCVGIFMIISCVLITNLLAFIVSLRDIHGILFKQGLKYSS